MKQTDNLLADYVLLPASPGLKEMHAAITKRQTKAANHLRREWPLGALVEFTAPTSQNFHVRYLGVIVRHVSWKSVIIQVQAYEETVLKEEKRYEIQLTPAVHPQLRRYTKREINIPEEQLKWID